LSDQSARTLMPSRKSRDKRSKRHTITIERARERYLAVAFQTLVALGWLRFPCPDTRARGCYQWRGYQGTSQSLPFATRDFVHCRDAHITRDFCFGVVVCHRAAKRRTELPKSIPYLSCSFARADLEKTPVYRCATSGTLFVSASSIKVVAP
jgi:hypothetical protein